MSHVCKCFEKAHQSKSAIAAALCGSCRHAAISTCPLYQVRTQAAQIALVRIGTYCHYRMGPTAVPCRRSMVRVALLLVVPALVPLLPHACRAR
jgi:hypothetical protein